MKERGITLDIKSLEYLDAEKEYTRLYHRNWRKKNKDNYVIVKIMFRIEDFKLVARIAKFLNLPIATLIKNVVLAYARKSFFIPPPKLLKLAITAINKIGNNINQQTRWIHTNHNLSEQNYQFMLDQIALLRDTLNKIYSQPISIKESLQEALKRDGKTARDETQEVLNKYNNDNQGNLT